MKYLDKLENFNDKLQSLKSKRETLNGLVDKLIKENSDLDSEVDELDKMMTVLGMIIELRQDAVLKLFEETVTSALQEIFNENYSFKIDLGNRNKSSSLDFLINTGEYSGHIPIKGTQGKSVSDVVSVVLRVMFVSLLRGMKVIALDESLGGVELDREMLVGRFIRDVAEKFNIQVIMVTHKNMIAQSADEIIEI